MMLSMTGAYSRGGVQAYSRRVAEILSEYGAGRRLGLHGVSLLDREWDCAQHPNPVRYTAFDAAAGNRLQFMKMSARAAWNSRPRLAVVMHTCISPPALLLRAARMTGPYLLVLHGIESWIRMKPSVRAAAAGAFRIVATTAHTAREFAKANGIAEDKFVIIPLAIAESSPDPLPPPAASQQLRVLTAGRLCFEDAYKGYDVLISGVERARAAGADVRLRIVGAGDDMDRLRGHASNLGLDGAVEFLGAVSDGQLRQEFSDCDIFALPSRGEGFGIVYLEAMALARPCIAGNHAGPPEIIDDGVDGYLVDHGNIDQLASRLVRFYQDPDLRAEMGRKAALKVNQRYLFRHMRDSWFKLLDTAHQ